jgi:hypothetical protein
VVSAPGTLDRQAKATRARSYGRCKTLESHAHTLCVVRTITINSMIIAICDAIPKAEVGRRIQSAWSGNEL